MQSQLNDCSPVLDEVKDNGEQLEELVTGPSAAQIEATVTKDSWRYDTIKDALARKIEKVTAQRQKSVEVSFLYLFILTKVV